MFYIKRKIKRCKFNSMGELTGLSIKPKSGKESLIKVKSVLLCDTEFKNNFIKKQMDKRLSKLYNTIYKFLISDDDSEDGVKACLGEIEKAKAIIFNKYQEHMKNKLYKEYLAKIVLTENEFRDKYMQRQYYSNLIEKAYNSYNSYEEEQQKGRSR